MNAKQIKEMLKNDNIFCHVSTNLNFNGEFYPRIPDCREEGEDTKINRICVSKTLEGAFTAIPSGGSRLDYYLEQEYIFKIFLIDIEKLNISKEDMVTSEELYEMELVNDAVITGEYWIKKGFTVPEEDSFIIKLTDWHEENENLIPHHIEVLAESEYDGDIYEAFEEFYGHPNVPCLSAIVNLEFISENCEVGEYFFIEKDSIEDYQLDLLLDNKSFEIKKYSSEIEFEIKESVSIKDLLTTIYNNVVGFYE